MIWTNRVRVLLVTLLLAAPLTASAQVNAIIIAPATSSAAPALGTWALLALAVMLGVVAATTLRRHHRGVAAVVSLFALALFVTAAYAGAGVVINGDECTHQTTHYFQGTSSTVLSQCPNPVRVVGIECVGDELQGRPANACEPGTILNENESCFVSCAPN